MWFLKLLAEAIVTGLTVALTVSVCAVAIKDAYVDGVKQSLAMRAAATQKERVETDKWRASALKQTADVLSKVQAQFVTTFTQKAEEYLAKISKPASGIIQ